MQLVDTHAHIFSEEFTPDRIEMLQRCFENGVSKIFMPNIDSSSIDSMLKLAEQFPDQCFPMIGLHPCSVKNNFVKELELVDEWLLARKFFAIGETGLDYHWDKTFVEQQKISLHHQAKLAKQYKLPIVLHTRESFEDTAQIIEDEMDENLRGIFHCFSGTIEQAQRVIDLGFLIGIGGVVTYKNGGLDKLLPQIDLKHIVLETDSPYLAPVPYRGKRNESSYLPVIAQRVAEIKNVSIEDVTRITTENAMQLFGI